MERQSSASIRNLRVVLKSQPIDPAPPEAWLLIAIYLPLIDIPNGTGAIPEMARVLAPGGALLIANLNSFNTACCDTGWIKGSAGRRICYSFDNYLLERSMWVAFRGMRIRNHRRPMSSYMRAPFSTNHCRARTLRLKEQRAIDGDPVLGDGKDQTRIGPPHFSTAGTKNRSLLAMH